MANEIYLSLVSPVCNEEPSLKELYAKIKKALGAIDKKSEIIFVDDGSSDNSFRLLRELAANDDGVKIVRFIRNYGQTAALAAGFDLAQGEVIIQMDADLQDDPEDIPRFLEKINEGYDLVVGWRKNRQDRYLTKTLPSKIANAIISRITKVKLHDYGSPMKAYRSGILKNISLYGEMHRFIPAYMAWHGAKIIEIEATHHARQFGQTKYTLWKTFKVILDVITVKFLLNYINRPMHFFGGAGFFALAASFLTLAAALILKFGYQFNLNRNPLLLISVFLAIVGVMFILLGLLAEILVRVYFAAQNKQSYIVKEKINL
ncbi:MAG: glycosyltransferase family 2 protein [Candidatus Portnoybacteria bacterium]|nr:glycosyltransferase family 2 protein [Candidatus Portnoybacteria bacterium]MDD4982482.1 glycosyltransferase family 2 protein [Candidatus Portnoybacteria bacterium]